MLDIGQKVRVKSDLKVGNYYGGIKFERRMKSYLGIETEILGTPTVCNYYYYLTDDEDRYEWSEEMLEIIGG